ncbi:uncharacterized protein A4U43_C04F23230 [Asparagus officinalis]|uniref:Uncharacterized protein n=1 Tax=Asparagus officinalis TaxID=4686 RepID=A0A5P1F5U7_ASPOF|nr:uncharacterized protein A4U43_C04F23230 [Asparagus officinalis]
MAEEVDEGSAHDSWVSPLDGREGEKIEAKVYTLSGQTVRRALRRDLLTVVELRWGWKLLMFEYKGWFIKGR